MAAGKSHVGKVLAEQLKYRFYDTDDLICEQADMDIPTIFKKEGEAGFRRRETEAVRELVDRDGIVAATGGGAILDEQNRKMLKKNGIVIYLNTALDIRYQRIQSPNERPLLMEGDAYQIMQDLDRVRVPIYETLADFIVDNNDEIASTVTKIIECIDETE